MKYVRYSVFLLAAFVAGAWAQSSQNQLPQLYPNGVKYSNKSMPPASGRSGSASVGARALLGEDGQTQIQLTTGQFDSGSIPPGNISKLQVQGYDPTGKQFTQNFNGLSSGGYANVTMAGLYRRQQIQLQANVDGIDSTTDVVSMTETIKLQPDLAILDHNRLFPATAGLYVPFRGVAVVQEWNGDVGASADCVMYVDGAAVDRVSGMWVDAGGRASCAFTYTFTSVGIHQVKYQVENVAPADWDMSNNSVSMTVQVVQPGDNLIGSASIYDAAVQDSYVSTYSYGNYSYPNTTGLITSTQTTQGRLQALDFQASTPWGPNSYVWFPMTVSITETADGATVYNNSIPVQYDGWPYTYGGMSLTQSFVSYYDPGSSSWLLISTLKDQSGNGSQTFQVSRLAGDVTYYSSQFFQYWLNGQPNGGYFYSYNWGWNTGPRPAIGNQHFISVAAVSMYGGNTFSGSALMSIGPYSSLYQTPWACVWASGGNNCQQSTYNETGRGGTAPVQ